MQCDAVQCKTMHPTRVKRIVWRRGAGDLTLHEKRMKSTMRRGEEEERQDGWMAIEAGPQLAHGTEQRSLRPSGSSACSTG